MLLKYICSFSLNAGRAPQLKASVRHLMGYRNLNRFFGMVLLVGVCLVVANAQTERTIQLTQRDKTQIIKSVLLWQDFLDRGLRIGEVRGIVYLSTENIAPELVPRIRDVRFMLLSPDEQSNWPQSGISLFEFSDFVIKGSKVTLSLIDTWFIKSNRHSYVRITYEFRKSSGKWVGHETVRSMARP